MSTFLSLAAAEFVIGEIIKQDLQGGSSHNQREYLRGFINCLFSTDNICEITREYLINLFVIGENGIWEQIKEEILDWE